MSDIKPWTKKDFEIKSYRSGSQIKGKENEWLYKIYWNGKLLKDGFSNKAEANKWLSKFIKTRNDSAKALKEKKEPKKEKPKITTRKDAGNVEYNIQAFNNGFSNGMGESMRTIDALFNLNRLNEYFDDTVILHYEDLDLGEVVVEEDSYIYTLNWEEPSEVYGEVTLDEYDYEVSREEIENFIIENDRDFVNLTDDEVEVEIKDKFDYYLEKHYDEILEHFKEDAIEQAIEDGDY